MPSFPCFHVLCAAALLIGIAAQDLFLPRKTEFLKARVVNRSSALEAGHDGWALQLSPKGQPNMCLDLNGGQTTNGRPIELWECFGGQGQLWFFDADTWEIKSAIDSKKCADSGNGQSGTQLVLNDCNGLDSQAFGYDAGTGEIFTKANGPVGQCLDVAGGKYVSGTAVQLWGCNNQPNQAWTIKSGITIRSKGAMDNNMCFDLGGGSTTNGAGLQIWHCNGLTNQLWNFETGLEEIRYAADTKKCLDAQGMTAGTQLVLWDCNGLQQQSWGYDSQTGGIYLKGTNLCADLRGGGLNDGSPVQLWQCDSCWNQQFSVIGPNDASEASLQQFSNKIAAGPCPPQVQPGFQPSCASANQYGWPTFNSQADLTKDQTWMNYFGEVYGETPSIDYPICTYDFWFLFAQVYEKQKITARTFASAEQDPSGTWPGKSAAGDIYFHNNRDQPKNSMWIWHPPTQKGNLFTGFASSSWVEVSHDTSSWPYPNTYGKIGMWLFYSRGSGIWFNTGNTKSYTTHDVGCQDLCGKAACAQITIDGVLDRDPLVKCAAKKGLDSFQFTGWPDDEFDSSSAGGNGGHFNPNEKWMNIEIVAPQYTDVKTGKKEYFDKKSGCGTNDKNKQNGVFKAGWRGTKVCDCDGSKSWLNCKGLASQTELR